MKQFLPTFAADFLGSLTREVNEILVDPDVLAFCILLPHQHRNSICERAKFFFRFAQPFFNALAFGDVIGHCQHRIDLTSIVHQWSAVRNVVAIVAIMLPAKRFTLQGLTEVRLVNCGEIWSECLPNGFAHQIFRSHAYFFKRFALCQ
nr:hypothetical protein [Nostoc sp. T09]